MRIRERFLARGLDLARLPRHVGFIPDGNRRWAKNRGRAVTEGHARGIATALSMFGWSEELGIPTVSLFMLSPTNLARAPDQASLALTEQLVHDLAATGRWRLRPIGDLDLLPPHTRAVVHHAATATTGHRGLVINMALGYTGRQDILTAVRSALSEMQPGHTTPAELGQRLTIADLERHVSTAGQSDLDLLIRTSGEQRLSGFLTWQAEQAELYFCHRNWPDFRKIDFLLALRSYQRRDRRFGA